MLVDLWPLFGLVIRTPRLELRLPRDFPVVRQVTTWPWLGLPHHGRGYGTEARTGLLALAFDHLGATSARTDVFRDNHASQAVSRKLGYEPDGISIDARDGEALVSDRLRLTRAGWLARDHAAVTVDGLKPCLPHFFPGDTLGMITG
ncbi:GNAT family protein [Actinoplanes sp. NPDC023714]|uniref:GNAT family N-acetyltransferase n=1 Tax=Actinoplanes sp. NPDC023714 TaxID=3154322 RepID=UPI0033C9F596